MARSTTSRETILMMILIGLCALSWREWRVRPQPGVTVRVLDVGQGDGILITGPSGQQMLIDGGPDLSVVAQMGRHLSLFDRTIDLVVLTHPDLDHVFGLPEVLRRYHVKAVLFTGLANGSPRYQEFLSLIRSQRIPVIVADPTRDLDMGDGLLLDVLWPPPVYLGKESDRAPNDTSIVLKVVYGEDSLLLTGDIEAEAEEAILSSGADVRADILKLGHHGSKTSTTTGFLLAVHPTTAIVSAGKDNRFNHPHPQILERVHRMGVTIRSTIEEGDVVVEMDGLRD